MAKKNQISPDEQIDEEVIYEGADSDTSSAGDGTLGKYRNLILGGVLVAVIAGAYFAWTSSQSASDNEKGQKEMVDAVFYFEQDSLTKALMGDGQSPGLEDIKRKYSGSQAANLATYYIGVANLKQGNVDGGIKNLEEYDKSESLLSAAAYAALGYAKEQKGQFAEAAEEYEKASKTPGENEFTTPYYLMHAARNYESAGQNEKALEAYRKIRDAYPMSQDAPEAEKHIMRLNGGKDE